MAFNKIEIFGGCNINYLWSKDNVLTEREINTLAEQGISSPKWDLNTIVLAIFDNSTQASNLNNGNIISYRISKKNIKENILRTVAEVDSFNSKIIDFNVGNNETYKYYVSPIAEIDGKQNFLQVIESQEVTPDWCSWSVIGLKNIDDCIYEADNDNIWTFHLDLEPGEYTPTFSKTFTEGMGRYPKGFSGNTNYIKGQLSCYIGNVNNISEYIDDDVLRVERWVDFCNNDQLKLIRDTKGNVYIGDIETTPYQISDYINGTPTKITFSFIQLDNSKDSMIFKVVS